MNLGASKNLDVSQNLGRVKKFGRVCFLIGRNGRVKYFKRVGASFFDQARQARQKKLGVLTRRSVGRVI